MDISEMSKEERQDKRNAENQKRNERHERRSRMKSPGIVSSFRESFTDTLANLRDAWLPTTPNKAISGATQDGDMVPAETVDQADSDHEVSFNPRTRTEDSNSHQQQEKGEDSETQEGNTQKFLESDITVPMQIDIGHGEKPASSTPNKEMPVENLEHEYSKEQHEALKKDNTLLIKECEQLMYEHECITGEMKYFKQLAEECQKQLDDKNDLKES